MGKDTRWIELSRHHSRAERLSKPHKWTVTPVTLHDDHLLISLKFFFKKYPKCQPIPLSDWECVLSIQKVLKTLAVSWNVLLQHSSADICPSLHLSMNLQLLWWSITRLNNLLSKNSSLCGWRFAGFLSLLWLVVIWRRHCRKLVWTWFTILWHLINQTINQVNNHQLEKTI